VLTEHRNNLDGNDWGGSREFEGFDLHIVVKRIGTQQHSDVRLPEIPFPRSSIFKMFWNPPQLTGDHLQQFVC